MLDGQVLIAGTCFVLGCGLIAIGLASIKPARYDGGPQWITIEDKSGTKKPDVGHTRKTTNKKSRPGHN